MRTTAALGGLDLLTNNASGRGPVPPRALLADTACEDLETALATNLIGPFRLTKPVAVLVRNAFGVGRPRESHRRCTRARTPTPVRDRSLVGSP